MHNNLRLRTEVLWQPESELRDDLYVYYRYDSLYFACRAMAVVPFTH